MRVQEKLRKTGKINLSFPEPGIAEIRIAKGCYIQVEDVKMLEDAIEEATGGSPCCNLIIAEDFATTSFQVLKYMGSEEANRLTIADAFILHSLPQRILARFYVNVVSPVRPTKFYGANEKGDAIRWLKSFL
ncbi:MAG: hypothetical protein H6585_04595 [Flavobacteriales bacterium]|nr:hypothetical protein [Flavobacteriales bacterium]MCB9447606.1 hypothetical protein [Flavobacteriales bacterium]